MTPYEIEFILHCYSKTDTFKESSIKAQTLAGFVKSGLVKSEKDYYKCTMKGEVLVKMLMDVPMPVECYINPKTKEII